MSLKVLSLYPDANSANEGFVEKVIDFLTGHLYGLLDEKTANRIVDEAFNGNDLDAILKRVGAIVDQVVLNPKWIAKSVPKKANQLSSEFTWIDGNEVTDPVKILRCFGEMLKGAKEAIDKTADNTKLRRELVVKIKGFGKPEEADALYEKHKAVLNIDPADLYLKNGGKIYSCVTDKAEVWPVVSTPKGAYFYTSVGSKKKNKLDLATVQTVASYGKAVIDLIKIAKEAQALYRENTIPDAEDCPLEYNDLKPADEILEQIYTSQEPYQVYPALELWGTATTAAKDLLKSILIK